MVGYGENGSVVGPQNLPTSSVASGVWSLGEMAEAQRDGIWPNPATSNYEYVAGHTFSGSTGTFTFTSIPQTYKSIRIIGLIKKSGNPVNPNVRINGVTSSTYLYNACYAYGSFGVGGTTQSYLQYLINPSNAVDYVSEINLDGSDNSSICSPIQAQYGCGASGAISEQCNVQNLATDPITSLTYFDAQTYSFAAGSTVSMFALVAP